MRTLSRSWSLPLWIVLAAMVLAGAALAEEGNVPISTSSDEALQAYLQARDLSERLRAQESIPFYQEAIAKDPNFAMAYVGLSLVEPTAKGFFERLDQAVALAKDVSEGEKHWILGLQDGVNGHPMKQREHYQKLVEMFPDDERAQNLLGNHYFGQQEWNKAIECYDKAIAINAEFSQPYNQAGYAYRFLGNYDKAEEAFKKYIELIPDDPNPYDSYAELLMKLGRYEESIEHYRKALAINDNFVASYLGIASDLNFLGRHEEARQELQKLLDSARDDGQRRQARFAMAVSYVDQGKYDEALQEIDAQYVLAEKIDDASAMAGDLNNKGTVQLEAGRLDQAQASFDKSIKTMMASELSSDVKHNAELAYLYNTARVALAGGDVKAGTEKAKEFSKGAEETKNRLQIMLARELMGLVAMEEGDYTQAMAEFGQANLQNPYNLYRAALVYQAMDDKASARKFCTKVVNFNALNSMNYAFIRNDARQMLESK